MLKKSILIISALIIVGCSNSENIKKVTSKEYKNEWPLTVESGSLSCEKPTHVIFTTEDGKKYGVNGSAAVDYPSILDITKDTENLGVKFKMPVDSLIDEGMKLCQK